MKIPSIPRRWSALMSALALLLLLVVGTASAQRRFPHQFDIDSRSLDTLYTPDATSASHRYRITAWGTYSMWEDTVNSSVDAMWIYSFPAEEWAKPEWRIFTEGYPIYVGDQRMLNSHGLRIDGQPMPQQPLNNAHRYTMTMQGDGRPISAMLIDWNFRNLVKRDAHDNNSGWLHVLVEELPLIDLEVCAIDSSQFPRIRMSVKVLRDSVRLEEFAANLHITENGQPVTIEKIDCSEQSSLTSTALVFDRSGSMSETFGTSTRMNYTRDAGKKFVSKLGASDEAAIYSFDDGITLDQTWTTNVPLLTAAINRLQPGGWTAVYDATMRALNDIETRPAERHKAVIVLTDGEDNRSVLQGVTEVIERARMARIPVFTIGLLLDSDDSLRKLASETGGRYFSVRDPAAMDSVFASIADIVFEKGCCSIYYTAPDTRRNGTWRAVVPAVVFDADTTTGSTLGYHAPGRASGVERSRGAVVAAAIESVTPNPIVGSGELHYTLAESGPVSIDIINADGALVATLYDAVEQAGEHRLSIDVSSLAAGHYFVRLRLPAQVAIHPLVVVR